ncbi:MAG: hypothetical protein LUF33_08540 [Clostridiales bacterium]|nr:hypothetical protein [Clostridiales bacterium]
MNCRLVFYAARKTSFCERAVQKSFSELNLTLSGTAFATDSIRLGSLLIDDFRECDVVFVIGGLSLGGVNGTKTIFSRALADSGTDEYRKLNNDVGDDGYVFCAGRQILVLLPDEPEQIEAIVRGPLAGYIKGKLARV